MKKIIALFLALMMTLSLAACGSSDPVVNTDDTTPNTTASEESPQDTAESISDSAVSFTVVVTDLNGDEQTFTYTSDAQTVGEALLAEGLIAGDESEYGLYVTTVNGITADWATENAYWAFYIDGEYAMTGVDSTELTDGATYSLVKTLSYTVMGEGETMFYFTVTDVDGSFAGFEIHTDATTVGEALLALELIAGDESEYGLYVKTVNGITADYDTDKTYWAFYIDGEYALAGVDSTEITADATYQMVKTISE